MDNSSSCFDNLEHYNMLTVPSVKLSIGSRSFSYSGPTVWNALPDYLRNTTLSIDVFKRYFKTFYLLSINTTLQRIRNIVPLRYIGLNWLIDLSPTIFVRVVKFGSQLRSTQPGRPADWALPRILVVLLLLKLMVKWLSLFVAGQLYVVKESDELRYTYNTRPVYVRPTSNIFLQ